MLQDSNVTDIWIEKSLRSVNSDIDSGIKPDLVVKYADGSYQFWEVQSRTDDITRLQNQISGYEKMFRVQGYEVYPGGVIPKP